MVKRSQLAAVLARRLETTSPKRVAKEVAAYLIDEKRSAELAPLMRDIMDYRASEGQVEASLISAHPLPPKTISEISKLITKLQPKTRRLILNQSLNPKLIGGFSLSVINNRLDLSIKAKLNNFKQLANQRGASRG